MVLVVPSSRETRFASARSLGTAAQITDTLTVLRITVELEIVILVVLSSSKRRLGASLFVHCKTYYFQVRTTFKPVPEFIYDPGTYS